jgi:diguanylate cyclase (GGDEF)-like protein
MAWHTVVIAVLALALAYDLYLHGRARRRARDLTHTDELTQVENRQAFHEVAAREFERARRYGHPFTLAYFDLDDFTEMGARFGHHLGDGMLRLVAEAARDSTRACDVVARLGGDQFALLLPETGPEAAGAALRKLQQTVRQAGQDTALPLTITAVVVTCLQPAESLEAVIGAADRLLHGIRHAGEDSLWCEVIAPQPLEGFEPIRLRRPYRLPPGFEGPVSPLTRRRDG